METKKIGLCCSDCHEEVKLQQKVTLDVVNTITHKDCKPSSFLIKDSGTFQELISKYPFLTIDLFSEDR